MEKRTDKLICTKKYTIILLNLLLDGFERGSPAPTWLEIFLLVATNSPLALSP